ncbi:MAG TPA: hypothetical protein VFS43_23315 [Polyangiaceae bacterium]|nr:hypothetical protein [Polyangiaceae bacterium]
MARALRPPHRRPTFAPPRPLRLVAGALRAAGLATALASCLGPREPPCAPSPEGRCAPDAPLKVEVWARTEGSRQGPFAQGMRLQAGDKIFVEARVSKDAHLYVLHCTAERTLERYPDVGSLPFRANERDDAPARHTWFVLDAQPGKEVIYIVASERALEHADPQLDAAIHRARGGRGPSADCGEAHFEDALAGGAFHVPTAPPSNATDLPLLSAAPFTPSWPTRPRPIPPSEVPPASPSEPMTAERARPRPRTETPAPPSTTKPFDSTLSPLEETGEDASAPSPPAWSRQESERPASAAPNAEPIDHTARGTTIQGGSGSKATQADGQGIAVIRLAFEH